MIHVLLAFHHESATKRYQQNHEQEYHPKCVRQWEILRSDHDPHFWSLCLDYPKHLNRELRENLHHRRSLLTPYFARTLMRILVFLIEGLLIFIPLGFTGGA
jgi:hypothetical protein